MTASPPEAGQGWLRAAYRQLYWWPRDRALLRPLAGVRTIVAFGESLGDNLLCANALSGLHASGAGPLAMLTPYPDLFAHLPFPVRCLPFSPAVISALGRRGPRLVMPTYGRYDPGLDRHVPPPRDHLIAELCRSSGLRGEVELKPLLHLTSSEREAGARLSTGHVLVQSSNSAARIPAGNKEWPLSRWQAIVAALNGSLPIAQIGARTDPLLEGAVDLRERLSRREVAAALAAARLFVGGEGFLMHVARAVSCRAVIVLGGRTAPHQTCYAENTNLFTAAPCAPCWQMNTCAHDRICLQNITTADVLAATDAQLHLPPLSTQGQRVKL